MTMSLTRDDNPGIFGNSQRNIGQRPHRNERDLMRVLMHHLNDQVGPEAPIGLAFRGGQIDSGKTIRAVPELGRDQLLIQRVLGSARYQHITSVCQRHKFQGVFQALCCLNVTRHHGQGLDLEFW